MGPCKFDPLLEEILATPLPRSRRWGDGTVQNPSQRVSNQGRLSTSDKRKAPVTRYIRGKPVATDGVRKTGGVPTDGRVTGDGATSLVS